MKAQDVKEVAHDLAAVAASSSKRIGRKLEVVAERAVEKAARAALRKVKKNRVKRAVGATRTVLLSAVKAGAIAGATAAAALLARKLIASRLRPAPKVSL